MLIPPLVPVREVPPNDQISILKGKIWIARLRTDRVVIFRTSASRTSNAAALIVAEIPAVIVLVVAASVAAVVALAALAVVACSGADVEN